MLFCCECTGGKAPFVQYMGRVFHVSCLKELLKRAACKDETVRANHCSCYGLCFAADIPARRTPRTHASREAHKITHAKQYRHAFSFVHQCGILYMKKLIYCYETRTKS